MARCSAGRHVSHVPTVGLPDRSTPTTPLPWCLIASSTCIASALACRSYLRTLPRSPQAQVAGDCLSPHTQQSHPVERASQRMLLVTAQHASMKCGHRTVSSAAVAVSRRSMLSSSFAMSGTACLELRSSLAVNVSNARNTAAVYSSFVMPCSGRFCINCSFQVLRVTRSLASLRSTRLSDRPAVSDMPQEKRSARATPWVESQH